MRFLAPSYLFWLWLLAVPLVLYLFKRRAREVPVSTLLFFRALAREHREAAWLRQVKRWLSLLLTLLLLALIVLALARPAEDSTSVEADAVVVVLDRSVSMAAESGGEPSLLVQAQAKLRQALSALPATTVLSVIAFDRQPEVLLSRSRNLREGLRLLEEVRVLPIAGDPQAAMKSALRLAGLETRAEIWWASDQVPPEMETGDIAVRSWVTALEEPLNAGITSFQIRPVPLERGTLEGYLEVVAAATNGAVIATRLEVKVAGRLVQLRELELKPGESSRMILPLEGVSGQTVEAQLISADDDLGWDDGVAAWLPQIAPLRVTWVVEQADPYIDLAVTSLIETGKIEVLRVKPGAWPVQAPCDVYLFEGWSPAEWPDDRSVILLRPPAMKTPLSVESLPGGGVPWEQVRAVEAAHPVLYRVSADRVALTQTAHLTLQPGLQTLWQAGGETLLAAGEIGRQRLVVTAFAPARSEQLPLLPAFPLLLGNAVYWCGEDPDLNQGLQTVSTGSWLAGGESLVWRYWDGSSFAEETVTSAKWMRADRVGGWKSEDGRLGLAMLGAASETDLPKALTEELAPERSAVTGGSWRGAWTLAQWLIAGVLLLLVLESYLFHRRAVY